jgi:ribosome-associated protein
VIDEDARNLAIGAARAADDAHATDILVLYVGDVLNVTEYFVIVSASNRRLVNAVVEDIEADLKVSLERAPVRTEGVREQQWVLIDYGDVVVHVFLREERDYYRIERLYSDAPSVDWRDPAAPSTAS